MNTSKSFVAGWGLFFGAVMSGAGMGWYRWKCENAVRIQEAVVLRQERDVEL
ncbi:hypothetical protein M885DRAFT_625068, partial [Pelagophyceae sp. CCMP2097]